MSTYEICIVNCGLSQTSIFYFRSRLATFHIKHLKPNLFWYFLSFVKKKLVACVHVKDFPFILYMHSHTKCAAVARVIDINIKTNHHTHSDLCTLQGSLLSQPQSTLPEVEGGSVSANYSLQIEICDHTWMEPSERFTRIDSEFSAGPQWMFKHVQRRSQMYIYCLLWYWQNKCNTYTIH